MKRFSLSIVEKCSVIPHLTEILIKNEILNWIIIFLSALNKDDSNSFMVNCTTTLLFNLVFYLTNVLNETNFKELIPGGSEFVFIIIFFFLVNSFL